MSVFFGGAFFGGGFFAELVSTGGGGGKRRKRKPLTHFQAMVEDSKPVRPAIIVDHEEYSDDDLILQLLVTR